MSDLIDREALKKKLTPIKLFGGAYCKVITEKDIDNAPTASPKEICIANIHFDEEKLREIVDNAIIRCKDCKHQKKFWHDDKRMKDKGYWVYSCELISDPFVGAPVSVRPDEFCSSAERRVSDEQE